MNSQHGCTATFHQISGRNLKIFTRNHRNFALLESIQHEEGSKVGANCMALKSRFLWSYLRGKYYKKWPFVSAIFKFCLKPKKVANSIFN